MKWELPLSSNSLKDNGLSLYTIFWACFCILFIQLTSFLLQNSHTREKYPGCELTKAFIICLFCSWFMKEEIRAKTLSFLLPLLQSQETCSSKLSYPKKFFYFTIGNNIYIIICNKIWLCAEEYLSFMTVCFHIIINRPFKKYLHTFFKGIFQQKT